MACFAAAPAYLFERPHAPSNSRGVGVPSVLKVMQEKVARGPAPAVTPWLSQGVQAHGYAQLAEEVAQIGQARGHLERLIAALIEKTAMSNALQLQASHLDLVRELRQLVANSSATKGSKA